MGASSYTISLASDIMCPALEDFEILVSALSSPSSGSLNRECAVRPPGSKVAAISELAVAMAT